MSKAANVSCRRSTLPRGFTVIELLAVVTLLAILLAIAAPGFQTLVTRSRAASLGNEFVLGVSFARAEAISRNKCVTMCVANDLMADAPQCVASNGDWNSGWIIFSNPKCDDVSTNSTAELLKVYVGDASGPTLVGTATPRTIRFDSQGRANIANPIALKVSPPGESATKMVCMDLMGRTRIGNADSISCDGSNRN